MAYIVHKFGGTSAYEIDKIADILSSHSNGQVPVVVVSAFGSDRDPKTGQKREKITDLLIRAAQLARSKTLGGSARSYESVLSEIEGRHCALAEKWGVVGSRIEAELCAIQETLSALYNGPNSNGQVSARWLDRIMSYGERLSTILIAEKLNQLDVRPKPQAVLPEDLGLVTNDNYGNGEPLPVSYENIKQNLERICSGTGHIPIIAGFVGLNQYDDPITLGRGGSDITATVVARAIGANEVIKWTDEPGIRVADPRIVSNARPILELSIEEAEELFNFGAPVVHPRAMSHTRDMEINMRIKSTLQPAEEGTLIKSDSNKEGVRALAYAKGIYIVSVHSAGMIGGAGYASRVLAVPAQHGIPIDVISTSASRIDFSVASASGLSEMESDLEKIADTVEIKDGQAMISVIGTGLKNQDVDSRTLTALARSQIPRNVITKASDFSFTVVTDEAHTQEAILALYEEFF